MHSNAAPHLMFDQIDAASSIEQIAGKRVLVRVDFNVPLSNENNPKVLDDTRIEAAIPTLEFLIKQKCTIVLASHLGRPKDASDTQFSLRPIVPVLESLLAQTPATTGAPNIMFCEDCIGETRQKCIEQAQPGTVILLENLRFHAGEQNNDATFAQELAEGMDIYINEAFSVSHRADASVVGVSKLLPSFAGIALSKEVSTWNSLMKEPKRPFVMIIGGAKISDKVGAVEYLTEIADAILVGGGTANNFLKAEGFEIYQSYLEEESTQSSKISSRASSKKDANYVKVAAHLLDETRTDKIMIDGYIPLPKIIMPSDVIAAESMDSTETEVVELTSSETLSLEDDVMYLDIGPKTINLFKEVIEEAGTIFWNGPLGVFEKKQFSKGTTEIAKAITNSKAKSIIGGGDTLAAVDALGLLDKFDYVSVAGGAALDFLSGKKLPGIEALIKAKAKNKSKK